MNVDHVHPRGWNHGITRGHIGHSNDAFKHEPRLIPNDVVMLRLRQRVNEFVGGVRSWMEELCEFFKKSALVFSACHVRFGNLCHSSLGDDAFVYQAKAYPIADSNER